MSRPLTYDEVGAFLWERPLKDESQGVVHYVHDGLGRLVKVVKRDPAGVETDLVRYGYDALGRLAWRKEGTNGEPVWMVYDGGTVVQEVGTNVLKQEYFHAGGTLVATNRLQEQTGAVRLLYLHQDRLGSLVMATEKLENGSVSKAGHAAYDPYGRPVWLEAWGENNLQDVLPYGYAGARWDDEAAPEEDTNQDGTADRQVLYLMGARWYDPELGRFLEQDPIGEAGGLNLYAYVGSSPTLFVDPSGLRAQGLMDSFRPNVNFGGHSNYSATKISWTGDPTALWGRKLTLKEQLKGMPKGWIRRDGEGESSGQSEEEGTEDEETKQCKAKGKATEQFFTPASGESVDQNQTGATGPPTPLPTDSTEPIWSPPDFTPSENMQQERQPPFYDLKLLFFCLWKSAKYGQDKMIEKASWGRPGADGSPFLDTTGWKSTYENGRAEAHWKGPPPPDALFQAHSHPNESSPEPTKGWGWGQDDVGTSQWASTQLGREIPVYSIHRDGIWKATPNSTPQKIEDKGWWTGFKDGDCK